MDKETSEIAKLTERISKDPKSKLFVPLAEEYKKSGDLEMAIFVLSEGLKNNPGYVTARSILGKLLLEKGDLEGSQKEFEEVVKAIPDNLMAQRKLGDIYVLRGRPDDALKHYKIVLSFNPRDGALVSLISDLEAGRDVRSRIHLPSPPAALDTSEKQEVKAQPQTPSAPVGSPAAANVIVDGPRDRAGSAQETRTAQTAPALNSQQRNVNAAISFDASASFDLRDVEEEPEEVLVVEPLEDENAEPEAPTTGLDFLAERKTAAGIGSSGEERTEQVLPVNDHFPEEEVDFGLVHAQEEAVGELETKGSSAPASEAPFGADFVFDEMGAAPSADVVEVFKDVPAEAPDSAADKTDDFTTDTLAELYIAQGFYEKAIDIYERMLADKPNSRGLKDKLERVRAMAEQSVSEKTALEEHQPEKATADQSIFFEPREYAPPVEAEGVSVDADVLAERKEIQPPEREEAKEEKEENLFTESHEYQPVERAEKRKAKERETGFDVFAAPPAFDHGREKTGFTDFEPREYVPPKAEPEPVKLNKENVPAAQKPSKVNKKETIERLESWLKNIKKET